MYKPNNSFKDLIFIQTKNTTILLFLVEQYTINLDIIWCHSLLNSTASKVHNQK